MPDTDRIGSTQRPRPAWPAQQLRPARPDDYDAIAAVVDQWWGRPVLGGLPRLYLDHFHHTSLIGADADGLAGFLVGLFSPADPAEAYVHFVGVAPRARRTGLASTLYAEFFRLARADGRRCVSAITAPVNAASIAFHHRLGFAVSDPVADYNGPGTAMVVFRRAL